MITAEVSFEGDVMYIGGKMITFEQTVMGDCWEIEGLDEAFLAYKRAKEAHIKVVAESYKYVIDEKVYIALMNYEVNIDD